MVMVRNRSCSPGGLSRLDTFAISWKTRKQHSYHPVLVMSPIDRKGEVNLSLLPSFVCPSLPLSTPQSSKSKNPRIQASFVVLNPKSRDDKSVMLRS